MVKKKFFILLIVWIYVFIVAIADNENGCSQFPDFMLIDSTQASAIISVMNNLKNLLEDSKTFANIQTSHPTNEQKSQKPMDCADIQEIDPQAKSGVHRIWPRSRVTEGPINVYCDMEDDGGAWTRRLVLMTKYLSTEFAIEVIQRRGDFNNSQDYFYKDWESYKVGFGDPEKDHWIGNDNIFALTNLRSNIVKFTLSDWEGNKTFAIYDEFWIDDESQSYIVHVSGYRGTAGDSFSHTNKMPFSTKDQDNDKSIGESCAVVYKGAWWYEKCHAANLNGMYLKGAHESYADGVDWSSFRGYNYSLKDSIIKIRPKHFTQN